jgi:predicted alpha/beta hydrolase family esterase
MPDIIILPGIGGSGPEHWQSRWQALDPSMRRFAPADWDRPDLPDWIAALDQAVADCEEPPILVAHSLACLLVAHWAGRAPIAGAVLVAAPDPSSNAFPAIAAGFADAPMRTLPFPSLIIASADDPFASLDYAAACAQAWDSDLTEIGAVGHINAASGLGDWDHGAVLLEAFLNDIE